MSDDGLLAAFQRAAAERRAPEALALFDRLPDEARQHPTFRARAAAMAGESGDRQREAAMLADLVSEYPDAPNLRLPLAYALRTLGQRDEAIAMLRDAIARAPRSGAPWRALAELAPETLGDNDVATMRVLLAEADDIDAIALHFALSWVEERRGNVAAVAEHVIAGNAIAARQRPEPAPAGDTIAARSQAVITVELLRDRADDGHPSDAPIFILGLPRSGSTLVEQVLAAHRSVEATLELPVLPQLLRDIAAAESIRDAGVVDYLAALPAPRLAAVGQAYLDRVAAYRRTDKHRFTDKLPGNWANAALIRLLFPNAVMIDTHRHPLATGWSIFRHHFPGGPAYANRLEAIGERIRANLAMMEHLDAIAPGAVHRVIHEDFVTDPDAHIRALLDRLGLAFDPACLAFHEQDRAVATASSEQVRRPVDPDRAARWTAYDPWLGPLRDTLGDALERWRPALVPPRPLA